VATGLSLRKGAGLHGPRMFAVGAEVHIFADVLERTERVGRLTGRTQWRLGVVVGGHHLGNQHRAGGSLVSVPERTPARAQRNGSDATGIDVVGRASAVGGFFAGRARRYVVQPGARSKRDRRLCTRSRSCLMRGLPQSDGRRVEHTLGTRATRRSSRASSVAVVGRRNQQRAEL
jgi:hypothetical protein